MENLLDLLDWIGITMSNIVSTVSSFFDYGEQIVVGVSGGADSMTLLHCLYSSNKNFQLIVAHVNHNIRGKESDDDQTFVENWCKERSIRFICRSVDVVKISENQKISVELSGRNERYKFFDEIGGRIATAHTLSDCVETMLFNISRGTGLKGLCSIPDSRGKIVRPLLSFTRDEIESYCKEQGIDYRNDTTNFMDKYTRNRIRHHVVSELKNINNQFEKHVLYLLNGLKKDEEYLSNVAKNELNKNIIDNGLRLKCVVKLEYSIKIRVIDLFLKKNNISPSYEILIRILKLCEIGKGRQSLPQYNMAIIRKNILFIEKIYLVKDFDIVLADKMEFLYKNLHIIKCRIEQYDYFVNKIKHSFLFAADYDKILGGIHIRNRIPGDKLKLLNRPNKKLKVLMQEKRVSFLERSKMIVISDDLGPFWVSMFGLDVRVLVDNNTKRVLLIFGY